MSPTLSNQIAAGEVIENPAAIVRELLDNSVDAGATRIRIDIHITGKGKDKEFDLVVEDNGEGMDKKDLHLAFERHATSKLERIEDLQNPQFLGFRGEGLASIASVSFMEVTTKTKDTDVAHMLVLQGGMVIRDMPVSAETGTTIRVSKVFYNLPVRRGFLKSASAELNLVKKEIAKHVLAHKGVETEFKVFVGEEITEQSSVQLSDRLKDKVRKFFDAGLVKDLIPINSQTKFMSVQGYVSSAFYHGKSRNNQFFMINKRVVKHKTLETALNAAYKNILEAKTFPACFVHIGFEEGFVDMNVHPTKETVRFQDDSAVYIAFERAIRNALYEDHLEAKTFDPRTGKKFEGMEEEQPYPATTPNKPVPEEVARARPLFFSDDRFRFKDLDMPKLASEQATEPPTNTQATIKNPTTNNNGVIPFPKEAQGFQILGQHLKTYILFASGEDLFVVDQHAADERFHFDRLQTLYASNQRDETQCLLTPIIIERSQMEIDDLLQSKTLFERFGLELDQCSKTSVQVERIPSFFPAGKEKAFLEEWITVFLDNKHLGREAIFERFLSTSACHLSLRGGDPMSKEQMKELIEHLYANHYIQKCPHGRPFVKKFSSKEVANFFKRT